MTLLELIILIAIISFIGPLILSFGFYFILLVGNIIYTTIASIAHFITGKE